MKQLHWKFAQDHPVITFLLINFGWTWAFWLAAIPLQSRGDLLRTSLVMLGGYGPAIGAIVTLGLRGGTTFRPSMKRALVAAVAALGIFGLLAARYLTGNVPNFDTLAADLTLTVPTVVTAALASLVGGWVVSSAVARSEDIRARMRSILSIKPLKWTVLSVVFFPAMVLAAWGIALLLGLDVEYPGLWGQPLLEVLPLYALTFGLTAVAQGGMEEPGWRGLMQPALQERFNPLVAALLVSLAWSLWHLPLYLNGFYPGDVVGGMLGSGIYRILLAIFLAWFYNRSGGSLLAMIILHTSFNTMVNYLPTSDAGLLILWLVVVVAVVLVDRMTKKTVTETYQAAPAGGQTLRNVA